MDPIEELEALGSVAEIQAWLQNVPILSADERARVDRWLLDNLSADQLVDVYENLGVAPPVAADVEQDNGRRQTATGSNVVATSSYEDDPLSYFQTLWRTDRNRALSEMRRRYPDLISENPQAAYEVGRWIDREASGLPLYDILGQSRTAGRWVGRLFGAQPNENERLYANFQQWWEQGPKQDWDDLRRVYQQAEAEGLTEEEAENQVRGRFQLYTSDNPQWLSEMTGGRVLTEDEKQRIVRYYNTFYVDNTAIDPDAPTLAVTSWEQLMPLLEQMQGTEQLGRLFEDAILNRPMETGFVVRLSDGQNAFIDNGTFEYMRTTLGLDEQDITFITRYVSNNLSLGGVAPNGSRPAGELVAYYTPFYAAALQVNGLLEPMLGSSLGPVLSGSRGAQAAQAAQDEAFVSPFDFRERPESRPLGDAAPSWMDPTAGNVAAGTDSFDRAETRRQRSLDRRDFSVEDNEQRRFERIGGVNRVSNRRQINSAERTFRMLDEGMRLYANAGMAIIHASSTAGPDLASRILGNLLREERWSRQDALEVERIYVSSGLSRAENRQTVADRFAQTQGVGAFGALGVFEAAEYQQRELERLRSRRPSGGGGGGGGAVRMMPDRTAVVQAVTDLYKQFFMQDPTPEEVNGLADSLIQRIMSTPTSQQVDSNAQLRAILSESPLYKELYGRMPEGFTEEELQRQVLQGQSAILGDDFRSKRAAQAGLADGRYQTAIGAAAASPEAFENSTFLGRLAQARQVLEAMT